MYKDADQIALLSAYSFATRLREAVHDKAHERLDGEGLIHFWDSSCLAVPMWGFRKLPPAYPKVTQAQHLDLLVGALFSSGQLGQVQLLPGHAVEFVGLARAGGLPKVSELKEFVSRFKDDLSELDFMLAAPVDGDQAEAQIEAMIARIQRLNPNLFVLLEAISINPQKRVARWLKQDPPLLKFATNPQLEGFSIEQPPFGEFLQALDAVRPSSASKDRANNPVDASVLRSLAVLVSQGPPYARFYTNTPAILKLARFPWVQDYFSYDFRTESNQQYRGTIWRNAEYYYLRSLFPSLSLGPSASSDDVAVNQDFDSPALDELSNLSAELDKVLSDSDRFEHLIKRYELSNGQPVGDIIATFQAVGMAHVWLSIRPDDMVKELVDGVRELWAFGADRKSRAKVDEMWRGLEDVSRDLAELRFLVAALDSISARLGAMHGVWDLNGQPRPGRPGAASKSRLIQDHFLVDDLLGHRWGSRASAALEYVVTGITKDSTRASDLLPLLNPHRLRGPDHVDDLSAVVGLMYGLELYGLVVEFLDRYSEKHILGIEVMYCAASIKVSDERGVSEDVPRIVRRLSALWEKAEDSCRYDLCLGFGHAFLEAAISQGATSFSRFGRAGVRYDELTQVMEFVTENLVRLRQESQARYAFAINFLSYATVIVPGRQRWGSEFALELQSILSIDRFARQYRFTDTLLYRELREVLGFGDAELGRQEACRRLKRVTSELVALSERTRSSTIRLHLNEARVGKEFLGCAQ